MNIDRDVGALEARMEVVENELHALRRDVRDIRDALVTARGGWKMLTVVVGFSMSFGAVMAKVFPFLMIDRP